MLHGDSPVSLLIGCSFRAAAIEAYLDGLSEGESDAEAAAADAGGKPSAPKGSKRGAGKAAATLGDAEDDAASVASATSAFSLNSAGERKLPVAATRVRFVFSIS